MVIFAPNMLVMRYLTFIFALFFAAACTGDSNEKKSEIDSTLVPTRIPAPKAIGYAIISQYPHDTSSFTEGLEIYNGKLLESGGDYSNSVLQLSNYKTGVIEKRTKMGTDKIFAEGITVLNGKLYQLTYQTNQVFVYDVNDFSKPVKTFSWPREGWGMSNNGKDLIITTKEPNLYFVDPETFKVRNTVAVIDHQGPVPEINELEYIDGFVWANVWNTNRIVKIDPESGHVVGEIYLKELADEDGTLLTGGFKNTDVLNGIAYDSISKSLLVTGKRWPKLYELRLN